MLQGWPLWGGPWTTHIRRYEHFLKSCTLWEGLTVDERKNVRRKAWQRQILVDWALPPLPAPLWDEKGIEDSGMKKWYWDWREREWEEKEGNEMFSFLSLLFTLQINLAINWINHPRIEFIFSLMLIGNWSPCLYFNPQTFSSYFLPCPFEVKEWESNWVNGWKTDTVNSSH